MEKGDDSILGYELEYFDPIPNVVRTLWMKYRTEDGTIELREEDKIFLKRIKYEEIRIEDLFAGNTISIYGKLMIIKSYCNSFTVKFMKSREVHILCRITQLQIDSMVQVLRIARNYNLRMGRVKMSPSDGILASAHTITIDLVGLNGESSKQFVHDTALSSLDSFHCEVVDGDALAKVWEAKSRLTVPRHSSLCIIKPHILRSLQTDAIMEDILRAGFTIEAAVTIHFSPSMASELFEGYKDAVPKYADLIGQVVSAPSLALMVTGFGADTVRRFREFCGPYVPEVAKTLRPKTLRATYGIDPTQNAVHCTDIDEHGEIECKYVFQTIAGLD